MSGLWYVIEKVDVATPCWTHYFRPSVESNSTFEMIASRDQVVDDNAPAANASYTGTLKVPNTAEPGIMRTQFSDSNNIFFHTKMNTNGFLIIHF